MAPPLGLITVEHGVTGEDVLACATLRKDDTVESITLERAAELLAERGASLPAEELDRLDFHISILSTPRRIACASEAELVRSLRPDVDGLIIRDGAHQAIFLPSVWAQLPDAAAFVRHLKVKAGLPADHWSPKFEAFRYTTESFGDPAGHA